MNNYYTYYTCFKTRVLVSWNSVIDFLICNIYKLQ